jgi:ParB/RepB/Spo0J family partition protein
MSYKMLLLKLIKTNPNNTRKANQESLYELVESIKQVGVLEPIQVVNDGKDYRIVFGERRYRAAQVAGLQEIPAIIKELTPEQEFEIMLTENLQREDLTAIEEALAFQAALEHGYTQTKLAERLGISQSQISNTLRLLKLPEEVQQDISSGMMSASNGRALVTHDAVTVKELEPMIRGATVVAAKKIINEHIRQDGAATMQKPRQENKAVFIFEDLNLRWLSSDIDRVTELYAQGTSIRKIAEVVERPGSDGKIEVIMLLLHLHQQGIVKINFGLFNKTVR